MKTTFDKNLNELNFVSEITTALATNFTSDLIIASLNNIFQKYFNAKNFKILIYDENLATLRDANRDWCPLTEDDKMPAFKQLQDSSQINKEFNILLNNKVINSKTSKDNFKSYFKNKENVIYLPLIKNRKPFGLIQFTLNEIDEKYLTLTFFTILNITTSQISSTISSLKFNEKLAKDVDFQKTLKDIAKIIEYQYELTYIIPLIGEMIDKFISEHLIYVFLKDENNNFKLLWPSSYSEKRLDPILKNVENNYHTLTSEDMTIGAFPIISGKTSGVIIADGKYQKLTESEINYLEQLTNQATITINRANAYTEILKYASIDALTGLNNRRQFEIKLKQETSAAKRKGATLCCMMLDIDHFKRINDNYGHSTGDFILKEFSQIITENIRDYDFAARYGGEEFCILLPMTNIDEAYLTAERLRQKVEEKQFILPSLNLKNEKRLSVKVSIGVSMFNPLADNHRSILFEIADKALYEAKKTGRNKVVVIRN